MLDILSQDVLLQMLEFVGDRELLMMSMTCKLFCSLVDAMQERMGRILVMNDFSKLLAHGVNFNVHEYKDQVIARIDCGLAPILSFRVMQALTGKCGEILVMSMRLKFLSMESHLAANALVHVNRWQLTRTTPHTVVRNRYIRHDLTLKCLDHMHKPTFLIIANVDLPMASVPRRRLCALTLTHHCMICRVRRYTYVAVDCAEPRAVKLCKRCANECMVTERVLVRDWGISHSDAASLRSQVLRYYTSTGHYFLSWIPKMVVCRLLGLNSWSDVMLGTAARLKVLMARRRLVVK